VRNDGGDWRPMGGEELLRLGNTASKSISTTALSLPGESRRARFSTEAASALAAARASAAVVASSGVGSGSGAGDDGLLALKERGGGERCVHGWHAQPTKGTESGREEWSREVGKNRRHPHLQEGDEEAPVARPPGRHPRQQHWWQRLHPPERLARACAGRQLRSRPACSRTGRRPWGWARQNQRRLCLRSGPSAHVCACAGGIRGGHEHHDARVLGGGGLSCWASSHDASTPLILSGCLCFFNPVVQPPIFVFPFTAGFPGAPPSPVPSPTLHAALAPSIVPRVAPMPPPGLRAAPVPPARYAEPVQVY
jgi:hypothetical protein